MPDGDQRDRDGREEFQREGGQEGDPQRAQRRAPVVVGDLADGLRLRLGPAEDLQGGQPGHHVQEVARQPGQQPPLPVHPGLGGPADEHHEQRDQRQRHHDDRRRHPVRGDDPGEHRDRDHDREAELRQIAGEVVVERVDAPGGQREHQAIRCAAREPARARAARPRSSSRPRSSDLTAALARWAASSVSQATSPRPAATAASRSSGVRSAGDARPCWKAPTTISAMSIAWADDQARSGERRGPPPPPGRGGWPGRTGADADRRFHVKHPLSRQGRAARAAARRRCAGCRCACGTPSTSSPGRAARAGSRPPRTRS